LSALLVIAYVEPVAVGDVISSCVMDSARVDEGGGSKGLTPTSSTSSPREGRGWEGKGGEYSHFFFDKLSMVMEHHEYANDTQLCIAVCASTLQTYCG